MEHYEQIQDNGKKIRQMMNKVPEITALFWITKVLTTGMGEAFSDYLVNHMNPILAVAFTAIVLVASWVLQFSMHRYVAWIYWLVVVVVSILPGILSPPIRRLLSVRYIPHLLDKSRLNHVFPFHHQ